MAKKLIVIFALGMFCAVPVFATKHVVQIGDNFFSPLKTTVQPGDTVRWEWIGSFPHSTTTDVSSPKAWDSGILSGSGNAFEVSFPASDGSGPFPYHCSVHSLTMKDTIFIGAPLDTDGDGLTDAEEDLIGTDPDLADTDADGVRDDIEVVDINSPTDTDGDGIIDALDPDDDNDSVPTLVEFPLGDTDSDMIANYLDDDDDGDGIPNIDEDANMNGDPTDDDSDGDTIPDYLDDTFSGGCCLGSTGNVDADPSVNDALDISDLLYLVDYFFADPSGPAPVCTEEADVDSSGSLDISDLLYLVDYFFADPSGPAPGNCL